MSYRGSLLTRIAGTVLIAFAWFAFLLAYLALFPGSSAGEDLTPPLVAGIVDAVAIGVLWAVWFLRDRGTF
jgi:succinate dehydrogenase/fumarate reductase cytochrome b subunit